jgi:hypothetical protein
MKMLYHSIPPPGTPSRQSPVLQVPVPVVFFYRDESSDKEDPPAFSPVQELEAKIKIDMIHDGMLRVIYRMETHRDVLAFLVELPPGSVLHLCMCRLVKMERVER